MMIGKKFFQRFGLFARKEQAPDVFDLRLQRIGTREARLAKRAALFRPSLQLLEA